MPIEPDDESDWKSNAEYTMWITQTSFLILMAMVSPCVINSCADFLVSSLVLG